jgi:hypothetical protein
MDKFEIKRRVGTALDRLYDIDKFLIDNNLCEPCINHRFGLYLQEIFPDHFVDCEYNRSHIGDENDQKRILQDDRRGNFVDLIIGKRTRLPADDFLCFETKMWSNESRLAANRDKRKLAVLTGGGQFEYKYGFRIVFGATRETVEVEVYRGGNVVSDW